MLLYSNNKFNILNWRTIVQNASMKALGSQCQSITPFGFEVTKNGDYLFKNLNRFYCHLSSPNFMEKSIDVEKKFISALLDEIHLNDEDFFQRISVIVYEHDKIKVDMIKEFSDNSILINVEQRITNESLLTDYAQFKVKAYNSDNILEHDIPLTYYNNFVNYINSTYIEFV